jgi:hypothetical protein
MVRLLQLFLPNESGIRTAICSRGRAAARSWPGAPNAMPSAPRRARRRSAIFGNVFVEQDVRLGITQQPRQRRLAVEQRAIALILAIVFDRVAHSFRRSSKRDKPSGPRTTASPSIMKLLALMPFAAKARSAMSRGGFGFGQRAG